MRPGSHRGDLSDRRTCLSGSSQFIVRNARDIVELAILKWASGCTPPFTVADALKKVDQALKQDQGDMAIWLATGHSCDDRGSAARFADKHCISRESDNEDSVACVFVT
jgi:hypothetical protein